MPITLSGTHPSPVAARLQDLLTSGGLDLPLPGAGATADRWAQLAAWGRADLPLARLAEGHADAVAILAEAELPAVPGASYGVWAARPGGRGAWLRRGPGGLELHGTVRFCSGAGLLDRALVVADPPTDGPPALVDVSVTEARADPDSWRAAAMAGSVTLAVTFEGVAVDATVGPPGWYTSRPGFAAGGGGVAAVWWGGAAGLLDAARHHLPDAPDPHQLAHLGELHALLEAADALLVRVASGIDGDPRGDHAIPVAGVRAVVERIAREVLDRVPRMLGAGPLSQDAHLAGALADLGIYLRQHHGERDHAALGEALLRRSAP